MDRDPGENHLDPV